MNRDELIALGLGIVALVIVGGGVFSYKPEVIKVDSSSTQTGSGVDTTEVAKHNQANDCWMIIENNVYNLTSYLSVHPGGSRVMIPYCGIDATEAFLTQGGRGSHSSRAFNQLKLLLISPLKIK